MEQVPVEMDNGNNLSVLRKATPPREQGFTKKHPIQFVFFPLHFRHVKLSENENLVVGGGDAGGWGKGMKREGNEGEKREKRGEEGGRGRRRGKRERGGKGKESGEKGERGEGREG